MIPVYTKTRYFMKHIFNLFILVILFAAGMTSCQKEAIDIEEAFDIENYTGRYVFEIELETLRDGVATLSNHTSVGYVTKESDYSIKILFDYAAPKVNCVYEYLVKPDGSFVSLYQGAGDRIGYFSDSNVSFQERIDLGNGNYKRLDFVGFSGPKE
jgi:hypothetical protein